MKVSIAGSEVYAYTAGESLKPDAPSLVFIHGAAMDHTIWTLFARFYAKAGYNVASLDLPGHGYSSGEPLSTIESAAACVLEVVDQMKLQQVSFIGHSMGSLIALEAAAQRADTHSLAMLGSCFPMRVGKPLLSAAQQNDHASVDMISLFGHSLSSQLGCNPVAGVSVQNMVERLMEQAANDVMYTDLLACHEYENGEQAAAAVSAPATLILGERDLMTPPRAADSLLAAFEHGQRVVLKDCGHMIMLERPEETHRALLRAVGYQSGRPVT
jgi:pimeloyl-ACP methyl ester carboxylesterase